MYLALCGSRKMASSWDSASADEYGPVPEGSQWIDQNLFNGEYYIQKIRSVPRERIAPGLLIGRRGTSPDPEKPEYQLGEGCLVDRFWDNAWRISPGWERCSMRRHEYGASLHQ